MKRPALIVVTMLLAACAASSAADPARNVEKYLQAKVKGDAVTMRSVLCSRMEAQLDQEANTFKGVSGVNIESMACQRDGSSDVVRCQGKIVALYGTEKMEFPLVAYKVVQEDGEWKWCGETQ